MDTQYFEYHGKAFNMLLLIGIGAAIAIGFGAIPFEFKQTYMLWRMSFALGAVAGLALMTLGFIGLRKSYGAPRQVTLTATSIHSPKSAIGEAYVEIPFAQITSLTRHKVRQEQMMVIKGGGEKLVIYASVLADQAQYEALFAELARRRG